LEASLPRFLDALRLDGLSLATVRARENALRQFGKSWGIRDLREVAPRDLEAYARGLLTRVGRETACLYLVSLRAFFRFLVKTHLLLVDPSASLPLPRVSRGLVGRILGREELARLLDSPYVSRPTGLRDRALVEFLYSTGLRAGEARRVALADLGPDAVAVRHGKGGKDRVVPVGARAMTWVKRYVAEVRPSFARYRPEADALWLTHHGRPFSELVFQQQLRKLGGIGGVGHLTCHMIRRTMATHLLSAGASPQEVSAILGHGDLKSLSKYIQVAARDVKETHARSHPREQ
jgi:integrase/recombinase XerD